MERSATALLGGNRTSLYRDNSGKIINVVSPNGRWLEFQYASPNCLDCVSKLSDSAGRSVHYEYDTQKRLVKVTDAEGGVTDYAYDANHRLTRVKDALGQLTGQFKVTNVYDAASGRVLKQTYADDSTHFFAYTLDGAGKIIQTDVTRERGDVRRLTFDANGRLASDTYALGQAEQRTVSYTRNAHGLVTDVTDGLGRVTHTDYDAQGNRIKETRRYGTPEAVSWQYRYEPAYHQIASITDPLGRTSTYTYNALGQLSRVQNALGNKTDYSYTPTGQLASIKRYNGATALTTTLAYAAGDLLAITDPLNRKTTFASDAVGRVVSVSDPLGRKTVSQYDKLGRVTRVTDPQGRFVQYGYDPNGNLLSFTDAQGHITAWTYDARNRPLTRTDALGQTERYAYDAAGNLKFLTDRKGQVSGFDYDFLNRRTKASFGAASTGLNGSPAPVYQNSILYAWDPAHRLTRIVDSLSGTINRSYDERFDTLTQESGPAGTVDVSYLANGLRNSVDPGNGPAISYIYDSGNRLTGIRQAAGAGNAEPATAQNVAIAYDTADRRTQVTLPNGIQMQYAWDKASQLTGITYKKADNTVIGNLTYGYDAAGQRIAMGGSLAAVDLPGSSNAAFDANNRLTIWNGQALTHDANGNLTQDGANSYTWNSRNQLTGIAGPVTASFAYDALGRRTAKTVNGQSTGYLYDGMNAIQEQSGATVKANILPGQNLDEWYARTEGGQTLSYLPDALGSTLALTDASQASVGGYTYEPYGKTTASGSATGNAYAYTGRENDGTGLYYYRARYYHPGISRFVSEDPIGLRGGDNLYGYVNGNPVSETDPFGLRGGCPVGSAPDANHICRPDPSEPPDKPVCVTPECAAGLPPNRPLPGTGEMVCDFALGLVCKPILAGKGPGVWAAYVACEEAVSRACHKICE